MSEEKNRTTDQRPPSNTAGLSRRTFLGGLGGAAAVAMTAGAFEPLAPAAEAAGYHRGQGPVLHLTNGDEARYPSRIGNFSKGLPHNAFGEVDPAAYETLRKACTTGNPKDFDAVILEGTNKLASPQGGLAFDLQGADAMALTVPAPPAIASAEMAGEMVEHYWMKLLLDVNFLDYNGHPDAAAAAAELNAFGADFKGPSNGGRVTPQTLFRDDLPGARVGPYISQFMWKDTPFGTEYVERKQRTLLPGTDHMTGYGNWLAVQNGHFPESASRDPVRRYIRNGRDLAEWVHIDSLFQAFLNASLIMTANGYPVNPGNPYAGDRTQAGPHMAALLGEVSTRALKATWHKKWQVHRRLRPEAYGGLVHNQLTADRYPGVLDRRLLNSEAVARVHDRYGTYLLPMVYPEGSPAHPSYTAGHATVAGACATVLKALFNESFEIPNPVVPAADGLHLEPYHGPALTVRGELNKLASNVATGRNIAGVHWRSDALESMLLGETVAISILRDQRASYGEKLNGFTFTKFDGTTVTV